MKRNSIHRIITGLVLMAALVFVCGCSDDSEQSVHEDESVYIYCSWWGNDVRHQYTLEALDEFMDSNGGSIQVYSKYSSWGGYENRMHIYMKSHDAPDVMQINYAWLEEYSPDGTGFYDLYELSDYIALDNYTEDELAFGEVNGKLNAIPIAFNTPAFFYNKTILDSYGLEVPQTWDDLFAAAKVMSRDGVYVFGTSEKQMFLMLTAYFEQTTGRSVVSDDGTLNLTRDDIEYMLDFYKSMVDEKVVMPIEDFSVNSFSTGKTACALSWISDAANYCDPVAEAGYEVTIGDYICEPDAELFGWSVKPATMYAISESTESPEAAAELLDFLLNSEEMAELQGTEKGIPISDAARAALTADGSMEGYEKQADDVRESYADRLGILSPVLEDEDVYKTFKQNADYYLYGKLTEDEVADNIYEVFKDK